jgi:hypothetical protein
MPPVARASNLAFVGVLALGVLGSRQQIVDLIGSRTLLAATVFTVVGIAAGWALPHHRGWAAGGRGRRPPSYSRPTDARPRAARPTSLASGAAVHRPTATGLTRRIRCFFVGVLEPCASVDVLNESREPHHHAGVPLPPVGVGRMAAPTVRVRLVSLPKTINHFGTLATRGQLGHERPEHLRRTRTDGIR